MNDPRPPRPTDDLPDPVHHLLTDILTIGAPYDLALTGDYAAQAHGLLDRVGRGSALELATEHPTPMDRIATAIRSGLVSRGWLVTEVATTPLSARLLITDPTTAEDRTLDLVKETFWRPPVETGLGPALSLEDVIGTKVRSLADRGAARDLIAVHATAGHWTHPELEELARRRTQDMSSPFDLSDLQSRLEAIEWLDDREFARHGLDEQAILHLRTWARTWADDIAERLLEEEALNPPTEDDPW
ncbi:hypothetical protein Sipo8835_36770 [Streptomyces ipomoeae]|uniref:Uncharacterized protein n=2 Tax=Streptomyces ipomoeae TaxID=103232 RepID=L1KKP0_9ACTN|nr:hypothetical protein [Streptomyces ipomoeae]EKX61356.1 hypothetical protein STRIP9103_04910 [Streptomyces ipomoeae 91-03]MDX2698759.1 hypothetical protein [Streptomyces ipomoeae]MDX2844449.1 hypothetical protein [Streptomyces ipomoeae]MDX2932401.1 hypothetical protein [Streptomyces ipomoeae]TQE21955.1 hypothetical protein Sipo8835_36770 [Streptomyces ipomoeae]